MPKESPKIDATRNGRVREERRNGERGEETPAVAFVTFVIACLL
jgi:hypothetical protein